jgi:hypothetical protein
MSCPHCAAPDVAGVTFCPRCRKRVAPPTWTSNARPPAGSTRPQADPAALPQWRPSGAPAAFVRPRAVTLLAALDLLVALLLASLGGLAVYASTLNSGDDRAFLAAMAVAFVPLGFVHFVAALGLLGLKGWGRKTQIALAGLSLVGVPMGTVVGILLLVWFLRPGTRTLFSGRRPADLPEDDLAEARAAARETGLVTAAAVIGLVLGGLAATGIAAAIAIPRVLVGRLTANEAAAIRDVREVVAAQAAYRGANGHYDRLECLAVPAACVPGYPASGPVFLPGAFVSSRERSGYTFHLEPGPSPVALSVSRSSASSMDRFAYLASPVRFRSTGRRIFCGDDTGRVCAFTDLGVQRIRGGRCSSECVDLP